MSTGGKKVTKEEHQKRLALVIAGLKEKRSWIDMANDLQMTSPGLRSWYYKHSGMSTLKEAKQQAENLEVRRMAAYRAGAESVETDALMGNRCGDSEGGFRQWRIRRGMPPYTKRKAEKPLSYVVGRPAEERMIMRAFATDLHNMFSKAKKSGKPIPEDAVSGFLEEWRKNRADEVISAINKIAM